VTDFPIKNKPPHNVSVLERWLTEASKQSGVAAGRLRRWLGFMIVTAMLDRARHPEDGTPLFLVKGGVAMELRVDVGARATKDLDTAFGRILRPSPITSTRRFGPGTATSPQDEPSSRRCETPVRFAATSSWRTAEGP